MKAPKLDPRERRDALKRPASHLRFTVRSADGRLSTLPPPPFVNETDVAGLEWWLEAHMNLAGGQLCVEQILASDDAFGRAVSASLETLRDDLYEMYCDAADPRMQSLASQSEPLGRYVRAVYTLADELVAFLLEFDRAPDRLTAFADRLHALPPLEADRWLAKLELDENNPVEPLRRLPRDCAALTSSVELLARVLRVKG
jgi:hypothetical protein